MNEINALVNNIYVVLSTIYMLHPNTFKPSGWTIVQRSGALTATYHVIYTQSTATELFFVTSAPMTIDVIPVLCVMRCKRKLQMPYLHTYYFNVSCAGTFWGFAQSYRHNMSEIFGRVAESQRFVTQSR